MKRFLSFLLLTVMLFALTSCSSGFVSRYSATMLIRSNKNDSCSASWETLDGCLVLNTAKRSGSAEVAIHFTASLKQGEMTVYYYDRSLGNKQKTELFRLKGGESIEDRGGYTELNHNIEIIIETVGKTEGGSVSIDFE